MTCQWQAYIRMLPPWIRKDVDLNGKEELQELRLRTGQRPLMQFQGRKKEINGKVCGEDLAFVINTASQYSPWAASTAASGYITALGGHRIGICGETVIHSGNVAGVRTPSSLCIRVARDFPGIAAGCEKLPGSILIIGPPGSGKTTLLRDLIRRRSDIGQGSVAVVDERGELFPYIQGQSCYSSGADTDILTGCPKPKGIDMVLRTMGPACIAVDEITEEQDCMALHRAAWSGVALLATAHAGSLDELHRRSVYCPILESGIFHTVIVLNRDKSWHVERI